MSISEAGWAAFERICLDIVNGLAHWIEREVERGPYDSRVARQRPDDDEDEDGDERGI